MAWMDLNNHVRKYLERQTIIGFQWMAHKRETDELQRE